MDKEKCVGLRCIMVNRYKDKIYTDKEMKIEEGGNDQLQERDP